MQNVIAETLVAHPLRLTLFWNGERLKRILLRWRDDPPQPGEPGEDAPCRSDHGNAVQKALEAYVGGAHMQWPDVPLYSDHLSDFAWRTLTTLRREVGWGQTLSYGELAERCGKPGAARSIGRVMALNPWPMIIPCHRIIGANGKLTGFSGAGLDMKRYLLETEGVLQPRLSTRRPATSRK